MVPAGATAECDCEWRDIKAAVSNFVSPAQFRSEQHDGPPITMARRGLEAKATHRERSAGLIAHAARVTCKRERGIP